MPVNWMDVSHLSFNSLLLLEQVQIGWMPGAVPENDLCTALKANPAVEWYLRAKCPSIAHWLDKVLLIQDTHAPTPERTRQAELAVMRAIEDWLVYVVYPAVYDAQPFLNWDSRELLDLTDFRRKLVLDIGAGTGRLTFTVAPKAYAVFAVEPVGNLRTYIKTKAHDKGLRNVFPVDGLMTDLPFPDSFFHITMAGHVFGDNPEAEHHEMMRVTAPEGMIILCPGNNDVDNHTHAFLTAQGYRWSTFEEPRDGPKRKYWKTVTK